jgi:hypothetical protein
MEGSKGDGSSEGGGRVTAGGNEGKKEEGGREGGRRGDGEGRR